METAIYVGCLLTGIIIFTVVTTMKEITKQLLQQRELRELQVKESRGMILDELQVVKENLVIIMNYLRKTKLK